MLSRADLFNEYQAAIVSACDPLAPEGSSWCDPALCAAMRNQECVVLTAWNPGFARLSSALNTERNDLMLAKLQDCGLEIWPAENASPDGHFREPGFLVWSMPMDSALRLAAEFSQFAIFAYARDGERRVVACAPD
ncbi:MAG: DUF3293 domain-containing protein [Actinomycetota bacterium]|nr:DUF3293 domain-containing protein [Actinomycetota bacterium]